MRSVKTFLRLGLCTVFLISISLVYGVNGVSAKSWKHHGKHKQPTQTTVIKLWSEGTPAFGIFVGEPYDYDAGEALAQRDLDFVFLDWEHGYYDLDALTEFANGLATAEREISLFVRIPPLAENEEGVPAITLDVAKQYVAEILGVEGVDGVVFPFLQGVDGVQQAVSCFTACGVDVWSPSNPHGTVISWLMLEDYDSVMQVREVANIPGISVLVTGSGSLSGFIGPEGGELGNQLVLAHTQRVGVPNVGMAFSIEMMADRLDQGFLGILAVGVFDPVDEIIQFGREYWEEQEFDEKEWRIEQREIANWWKRQLK